jgi:hypothetical protein
LVRGLVIRLSCTALSLFRPRYPIPPEDPATLSITVFNAPADAAALAPYREAGIARVLFEVPDAGRDDVLRRLDRYAPLTAEKR